MNYQIRDATLADTQIIADYNSRMAEETVGRPLNADIIGPGVSNLLADIGSETLISYGPFQPSYASPLFICRSSKVEDCVRRGRYHLL